MLVSKEISDYFPKTAEPLVITQRLEKMFDRFKKEIAERSEEKFTAQNQKIMDLEEQLLFKRKS